MSDSLPVFGRPGRHVQGAGAIDATVRCLAPLGTCAVPGAGRPAPR